MPRSISSDEAFIMTEDQSSITDERTTHNSPDTSLISDLSSSDFFHSVQAMPQSQTDEFVSFGQSTLSRESSMENIDLNSDIHGALEEGYVGLDIGTIRRTLPRPLWYRHEKRSLPNTYVPSYSITRYSSAAKSLLPFRRKSTPKELIPVDDIGLFSLTTFSWMTPFVMKSYKQGLKPEDVPLCTTKDSSEYGSQRLEYLWKQELASKGPDKASFMHVCVKSLRARIAVHMFLFLISLTLGFVGPMVFMRRLLEFCENEDGILLYGFVWATATGVCELMRAASFTLMWGLSYRNGVQLRSACMGLLYKKIIKLATFGDKSIGELVNLFANDSQRVYDFAVLAPLIIGGPFVAIVGTVYIYWSLGAFALLGMVAFVLFYPIQYLLARATGYLRRRGVRITDQRVRLMNEILSCIRLIKMYAWEKSFIKKTTSIREEEKSYLQKSAFVNSVSLAITPTVPIIALIVTFLAHVSAGNNLTAAQVFTVWCVWDVMAISSYVSPMAYTAMAEFLVSAKRIQAFTLWAVFNGLKSAVSLIPYSVSASVEARISFLRIKAMVCVAFMNARMRPSLNLLRDGTKAYYEARVSFNRMKSVLLMDEVKSYVGKPVDRSLAISIGRATFAWDCAASDPKKKKNRLLSSKKKVQHNGGSEFEKVSLNKPTKKDVEVLFSVSVLIPKGKLVGVCGGVGSGKSSLLSAMLGHMRLKEGNVAAEGSFAYVTQQAWIMNATLRENILFGELFDAKRYYNAIWSSALNQDISSLPAGDETEIGERGINLSGGQRQRVAMARAVYANKDIYLLDDPLSAVDAHVGKHIFDHCMRTALKEKTVVLVTHQLQFLSQCDEVIFMHEGRVVSQGSHSDLMERTPHYASLINTFLANHDAEKDQEDSNNDTLLPEEDDLQRKVQRTVSVKSDSSSPDQHLNDTKKTSQNGKLMTEEKMEEGSIPFSTYNKYIQAAGGYFLSFFILVVFVTNVGSTAFSSWWLSHWLKQGSGNTTIIVDNVTMISTNINDHPDLHFYELVYGLFIVVILVSSLLRGFFFMKVTLRASSLLHNQLFVKIMRSPMRFFDTTPLGRILNVFSRDLDELDTRLPVNMEGLIQNVLIICVSLTFVALVLPWFLIVLFILTIVFVLICKIFRVAVRDLKRIENISRSPIFSHVSATVQGLSTVRAFGKEREFLTKFMVLFDENTSAFFLYNCAMRWLSMRLDLLAACVVLTTAFLVVMLHGVIHAALAGLALAYSTQLSGILQYTVRLFSETESRFTSVQRITGYLETLESEGPAVIENRRPPADWPKLGSIRFMAVKMRYRPDLPLVLKGLTLDIEPREKIGIVGRTGSGKSSLGLSLFRLVDLSSGTIKIDNINVAEIGLEDLRSRLSVIPQDPVLFIGTIRYNLDPFEQYPDSALWGALEKTYMKEKIAALPGQLQSPVVENGENFSVGERQLLCMARALLRHSKILLLDEATAAIDTKTDALVQKTLRDAFADCTMLTIAHRLNTVLQCDRVLVLEEGKVVEFDRPSALLNNPSSLFAQMITAAETASKHLTNS